MKQIPHKIFICAGEASGDLHAASLIHSIRQADPESEFFGVVGPAMEREGCTAIERIEALNVMGIADVIRALPRIRRVEASLCDWTETEHPDLAILVDFPGFNVRLGKKLKKMGIPVIHYIAPKLWAWGAWRSAKLKDSQDLLASILPFEVQWFKQRGIDANYVGNPSAFSCQQGWSRQVLNQKLAVDEKTFLLALLPGSRSAELSRHLPLLMAVNEQIRAEFPHVKTVTTRAPGVSDDQLKSLIDSGTLLLDRMSENYAMRADAAVAVSGTATLELALWDVPTVLVYKNSPATMWLGRKLLQTECVGLANILLDDQMVMPELIQEQATVENIMRELRAIISGDAAKIQRQKFGELRVLLGESNPAETLAKLAINMITHP